jgi:hypothetical protein
MGPEYEAMKKNSEKLGGKKYKLQFLLNAFSHMQYELENAKLDPEPDYEAISQFVDSDYLYESYEGLFNDDTFWENISEIDEDDILKFVMEKFDEDSFIANLFSYPTSSRAENKSKEAVTLQEIAAALGSGETDTSNYWIGMIDSISGLKAMSWTARDAADNLIGKVISENSSATLKNWLDRYNYNMNEMIVQRSALSAMQGGFSNDKTFSEDEALSIARDAYKNVATFYVSNIEKMPYHKTDLDEEIQSFFEDDVKNKWFENNKNRFAEEEAQNQAESAASDFDYADRRWAEKELPPEEEDPNVRHYRRKTFTERMKSHDWLEWDEESGQVNVNLSNPFVNFGINDWEGIAKDLEDMAREHHVIGVDEYVQEIKKQIEVIKWTVASDPNLLSIFSEERNLVAQMTNEQIGSNLQQIERIISDMPAKDAEKMKKSITEENPNYADLIEAMREYEEQQKVMREQQEQLKREEEARRAEERSKREEIAKHVEEQKKILSDPSISLRSFENAESEKAIQEGIIQKPFEHISQLRLDARYPGGGAFERKDVPMPSEVPYQSFHIAIYPKKSASDPVKMETVFDRQTGLNFHGYSIPKQEWVSNEEGALSQESHYDFIGWIGGTVDLYNKIMYINEIQSDIMQNTPRMKDPLKSLESLSQELAKLKEEHDKISKNLIRLTPDQYYELKIKELKQKIANANDQNFVQQISKAIEKIEQQKAERVDPFINDKSKLLAIEHKMQAMQKQINDVANFMATSNAHLNRPHLSEFKSKVENRFADWLDTFYNEIFMYCSRLGIKHLFVASASYLYITWRQYAKASTMELYKKLYDEKAMRYGMKKVQYKNATYWHLDLTQSSPKFASINWYKHTKCGAAR